MNTSQRISRAALSRIAASLAARRLLSRVLGAVLFLAALVICICVYGWGSGIFAAITVLMAIGCLSVLLRPFRYISIRHLCAGYLVIAFVEFVVM